MSSLSTEPKKARKRKPKASPPGFTDPHVVRAVQYAERVCSGAVPASKWTVFAAQRFLRDLDRAKTDAFPYRLDEAKGGKACRFVELLPHVAGPLFGQTLKLEDWQCFVQAQIWGWVSKKSGLRRFRRAQVWVPRGNGKSFFASGSAVYALAADGEGGAQIAACACTRDQARLVLDVSRRQLQHADKLRKKLGVEVSQHAMFQPTTNSTFKALSSEANTLDGLNLHFAVLDELHAHTSREVFDVVVTGLGKRSQPMLFVISTAGSDQSGIGYEQYSLCRKILSGVIEDERTFVAMWEMDDGDDPFSEETWAKANPNLGVSVDIEHLRQEASTAQKVASARSAFLTKHLNAWVNANQAWFNMGLWAKCVDATLKREAFAGESCYVGLDLASRRDVACKALVFPRQLEGKTHYFVFLDSWLPEDAVRDGRNASYVGWAHDGWLKTTPGNELDLAVVEESVLADRELYDVREVPHDPHQALQMAQRLSNAGMTMVEIRPSVVNFNIPMKELEAASASGRLHVEDNPLLHWMASNVVAHRNAKDEVYPRKEQDSSKIDGIIAILNCVNRILATVEDDPYADPSKISL